MIKNLLILALLMVSVNSCAVAPRINALKKGIDPKFKHYVTEYRNVIGINTYKDRFDRLSMNFAKLEPGVLGRCYWLLNGEFEIEIDRSYWDHGSSFYGKQYTAYHELEHCIRYRLHTDKKDKIRNVSDFFEEILYRLGIIKKKGYLKDGCPASIMNSFSIGYTCQYKHFNYYIEEMKEWEGNGFR